MKQKLVLIGNGMAGMRVIDELLKLTPEKYQITVFGSEPHGNYNRIMLSPVLAGDKTIDDIVIHDKAWYQEKRIELHTDTSIAAIDRINKQVITEKGYLFDYDRLILATGSNPFILPIPGNDLPGVISFRDIADVNTMLEAAKTHKHAVVIGGGLLGLEAANGLRLQGMDVTVVHIDDVLMGQQIDKAASGLMQAELEATGLNFLMSHRTEALLGNGRVEKVRFSDGSEIPADLVVMAAGIRPNINLAKDSGLQCERGILVNDTMQTYSPEIYAVGECIQHREQTFGLVAPLYDQAKVCANHLAEWGMARYVRKRTSTQLKVTGINVFSAGDFSGDEESEILTFIDPKSKVYKKLVLKEQKIIGAILYGETRDGNWYFDLMINETDVSEVRETLVFGQQYCELPEKSA